MKELLPRVRCAILLVVLTTATAVQGQPTVQCSFDGTLAAPSGTAPVQAEGVALVPGHTGQAALVDRPARLAYPARDFRPEAFTISFRIRHDKPLEEYYFKRLVYFYHETPDMKNRIGILKREATNQLVFFLSDGQGRAKGNCFAGNWFAMVTEPVAFDAGTWHEIVCTADKANAR